MENKKKDLVLICNKFPYGFGEVFLEAELPYLHKAFQRIIIVTITDSTSQTRTVPKNVILLKKSRRNTLFEILQTICYIIIYLNTFLKLVYKEIISYRSIKNNNPDLNSKKVLPILIPILNNAFKAFNLKLFLKKNVLPKVDEDSMFYSYWQDYTAVSLALIKKENPSFKAICRAHGGDVYFFRSKYNYLPFRRFLSSTLNQILFISQDGMNYQTKLLTGIHSNYFVSRLGTKCLYALPNKANSKKKVIVSCSNLVPGKRVHLIIKALSEISDLEITWIHFGDGPLRDEIRVLAKTELDNKKNISFEFKGNVQNNEIHKFYSEQPVSLFINVSDSEGIPVSIMEAMSYGIPAIATDVGGTRELLDTNCGFLIDKNIDVLQIAKILDNEVPIKKRIEARKKWEKYFCAETNFNEFISLIT